jgi:hypothetical protein
LGDPVGLRLLDPELALYGHSRFGPDGSGSPVKIVAIASRDFGEFAGALYFLRGINPATPPILLTPRGSFEDQDLGPGVNWHTYTSLAELQLMISASQPDVVLLFSGYLLNIGGHLSVLRSLLLLRFLRRRRIPIMTSDPFIGLQIRPSSLHFTHVVRSNLRIRVKAIAWLIAQLIAWRTYVIHRALRREAHLYLAPLDSRFVRPGHRMLHYYNPRPQNPLSRSAAGSSHPDFWLFVMSQIDFAMQFEKLGPRLATAIADRISDARGFGKSVVLIGPAPLLAMLKSHLVEDEHLILEERLPYGTYIERLVEAEYAFFWNYYSYTLIHRVIANRPIFFFDPGHMIAILPALDQAGIASFYRGWRPPLVNLEENFDPALLRMLEEETCISLAKMRDVLMMGADPAELLASVVTHSD